MANGQAQEICQRCNGTGYIQRQVEMTFIENDDYGNAVEKVRTITNVRVCPKCGGSGK